MKQTEFEEMVAINLALGGKYDVVVDEVGKVLKFGAAEAEEEEGPRNKRNDLKVFALGIQEFLLKLTTLKTKCSSSWLDSKFLSLAKDDKLILDKNIDSIKSFFEKETNLGNKVFQELFVPHIKNCFKELNKGIKFEKLWSNFLASVKSIINIDSLLSDIETKRALQVFSSWKKNPVVKYFLSNYGKSYAKITSISSPNIDKLFTTLNTIFTECYTLTEEDFNNSILKFENQVSNHSTELSKSTYLDCTVLSDKYIKNITSEFANIDISKKIIELIKLELISSFGKKDDSLKNILQNLAKLKFPTYQKTRDSAITDPLFIINNIAKINLNKILIASLNENEACFIEKQPELDDFKLKLSTSISSVFLRNLKAELGTPSSNNNIPKPLQISSVIKNWTKEAKTYPTYSFFLQKIKDKSEQLLKKPWHGINELKLSISKAILSIEQEYNLHELSIQLWAKLGKEKCLSITEVMLNNEFFPDPRILNQKLNNSTIGISKDDILGYLSSWKNEAALFIGNGVKAIYRYNFKSTKFKVSDFLSYLKDNGLSKGQEFHRVDLFSNQVLTIFGTDTEDSDVTDSEKTESMSKLWIKALSQFDENIYFSELFKAYSTSQNEFILSDFKSKINFILPNSEDLEFALLYALMHHPSSSSKGSSNLAWRSVEIYKNHRESTRNWLEKTKFAIDEFYQKVHNINLEYSLAKNNYSLLYDACNATVDADNAFKLKFAEVMFGSVINLAFSALEINKALMSTKIGGLIKEGKDNLITGAAEWAVGKDTLYKSDAEFIFSGIGGDAEFSNLTRAVDNIKTMLLNYVDTSSSRIHLVLELEGNPGSGLKNTEEELTTNKSDYSYFIQELSSRIDKFIADISALDFDGWALSFEKLMVAYWIKESSALTSKAANESFLNGWSFVLPRTDAFVKKVEQFEICSNKEPFKNISGFGIVMKSLVKALNKSAYADDFKLWDQSLNEIQSWANKNADLKKCTLFKK